MTTEPSSPAPAVVAVVVTSDPGPWLAEALASIEAQDYPNLSVLVVDAGCEEDPTPLVAAATPTAFVRRMAEPVGFGRAANEVLDIVEGASHFLFCHDDVALAPEALRVMVEEAFRSNAGIVSPKYVRWDDPQRLLAVGLTTDKVGVRRNLVEPNELDQEQHDSVREILVAPSGATLVRADLFSAMGGYSPLVEDHGEDMDLSWRAWLYGARVVAAPAARVRHLEGSSCPAPPVGGVPADGRGESAAITDRNRYRTLITCYRLSTLMWILPLAVLWAMGEAFTLVVQGRSSQARSVLASMSAGLRAGGRLRRAHSEVAQHRSGSDGELRAMQVRGNARLRVFVQSRVDDVRSGLEQQGLGARLAVPDPDGPEPDADGRAVAPPTADRVALVRRLVTAVPVLIVLVFVVGSRSLLGVGLPQIGTLPTTSVGYGAIWHEWWSAWQPAGLGVGAPSSPGLALLGLLGTVLVGAVGTLGHVVVLGPLLVGPLGMWRAARHWGSAHGRVVAGIAYAIVPLPYNALAGGHWDGLIVYAGLPWALSILVRLSAVVPAPVVALERVAGRVVLLGLLVAAVSSIAPSFVFVLPAVGFCLFAGSVLTGLALPAVRLFALAIAASVVAFVVLLPWSATVLATKAALAGPDLGPAGRIGLGQVLRFHTGPYGSGGWEWLLLPAAALPLLFGRGWRLEWAARMWVLALVSFGWAWAGSRGWVPALPLDVVLVPAAVALAVASGLGVSAFEIDLPGYNFGWRQGVAAASALCLGIVAIPWIAASSSGRWDLPTADTSSALAYLPGAESGDYRVLWVGYPTALPLQSRQLQPGLAYATSTDGEPDLSEDLATGPGGASGQLAADLRLAQAGLVTDVGHLLAPAGVRFIVIPNHVGPSGAGGPAVPVPAALLSGLGLQTDLQSLVADPNYTIYLNAAWAPVRMVLPQAAEGVAGLNGGDLIRQLPQADLAGATAVLTGGSADGVSGLVPTGQTVEVGSSRSGGWHLSVGGHNVAPTASFGWAMSFAVPAATTPEERARLGYGAPLLVRGGVILGVILWLAAASFAVSDRRRRSRSAVVEEADPSWFEPASTARPIPQFRRPVRPAGSPRPSATRRGGRAAVRPQEETEAEETWTDV